MQTRYVTDSEQRLTHRHCRCIRVPHGWFKCRNASCWFKSRKAAGRSVAWNIGWTCTGSQISFLMISFLIWQIAQRTLWTFLVWITLTGLYCLIIWAASLCANAKEIWWVKAKVVPQHRKTHQLLGPSIRPPLLEQLASPSHELSPIDSVLP